MKIVNVIYGGDLREIQGINKVTENLIRGRDIFLGNEIELRYVITNKQLVKCLDYKETIIGDNIDNISYKTERKVRVFLKNLIFFRNRAADAIKIYHSFTRPAKKSISNYKKANLRSDVIIFQDFLSAYYFFKKANERSVKTILILHGIEKPLSQLLSSYPYIKDTKIELNLLDKFQYVLSNVDRVVFVSKQPIEEMCSRYNRRFDFIYNGIKDIGVMQRDYMTKRKKFKFVTVASVNWVKGHDLLVEALNLLDESYRKFVEINIVGDGPKLSNIKKQVDDYKLNDCFVFWGARNDIDNILNMMDIFILPSRHEGLPISIIEAMRSGMPIISTGVGGIPEMIDDGINGILMNLDTEAIKQVIMDVVDGKVNLEQMGKQARNKYESTFNLESMVQNYSTLINEILDEGMIRE
jgi:glycosyltransferase involved in cell wall biosynthesis